MDFVVSKVAMSVCALLVLGVLGGAIGPVLKPDHSTELRWTLVALDELFLDLISMNGPSVAGFAVPSLSDRCTVRLSVEHDLMCASCAHAQVLVRPSVCVHTWHESAYRLNDTLVEELDSAAQACVALTGRCLAISLESRILDDDPALMIFVRLGDEHPRS